MLGAFPNCWVVMVHLPIPGSVLENAAAYRETALPNYQSLADFPVRMFSDGAGSCRVRS